jgi:putative ABC transport system ATP-binding protein
VAKPDPPRSAQRRLRRRAVGVAADAHRLGPTGHFHFRAALAAEFLVAALDARLLAPTALVLAFHGNLLAAGMGSNKGATASLDVPTADSPRGRNIAPPMASPLLDARGLTRSYRLGAATVPAVAGVSLTIHEGEFVALQGPSGSGKTTLLNLLGLLDRPDSGSLAVNGCDAAGLSENDRADLRRDRFGFVFQTFNLIPVLSAEENVEYPMALARVAARARRSRAQELLAAVGLAEKAGVRPDLLSGGQRQRVAIARALANGPAVVFADEPTANLDSRTAEEILDLMRGLCDSRRVAFLFATHDPRVVARARRVVSLHDGRVESDVPRASGTSP